MGRWGGEGRHQEAPDRAIAPQKAARSGARNEKNRLGGLPRAAIESAPVKETYEDR